MILTSKVEVPQTIWWGVKQGFLGNKFSLERN